ncbi:annexin D5 [Sesamum indicum]|uniref:Annexin n=1 Tax=Sesamum indicum TaxID=4182 RepID=A0A6I9STJ1_SESIN|nr:annexin D5 [Sesamum indicum]
MATLSIPPVLTTPRDDAMQLYRAFKGFGCDTAAVVNILAHRDATQRLLIEQEYRTMYSTELSKRLASELSGNVEKAILLWMPDPAARDATIIRQALTGDIIDLKAATEVICSRTSPQIQYVKQIYHARFHAYLEHDIEYQASGDHKKLLLACISSMRYEGPEVDKVMAEKDAKSLYKAGEKKLGTDEKTFIHIFSERSRAHLVAVASAYHSMYGNSLKKAIKSETSGHFEFALLTILQCAENPGKYFAKVLHKAMKGMGTDDTTLTRVIVTRAEIDMQYIKAEYHKKYGKSLNDAVHSETSSHYRTFLLSLLGATHR